MFFTPYYILGMAFGKPAFRRLADTISAHALCISKTVTR